MTQPEQVEQHEKEALAWPWRGLTSAYREKEPRQQVVSGQLQIPSLNTTYGPPGTLKTMIEQDRAICVAGGKPWLPALPDDPDVQPFAVMQSPVLWIDVDNGLDRIERRFAAIGKAHSVPKDAPLFYVSFPTPPFIASDPESVDIVLEAVYRAGARLVIFDNLGTVSGGADENSSQMVAVMSGLRQIAEAGNCAVVVIHHKSKGDRSRVGDSLRGHSSIEGAVDLALLVHREDGEDTITLRSTKTRDIPIQPFSAMWTYEQDSSGELVTGRFFGLGRPESVAFTKQEQAELCILKDMDGAMNQSQLVDLVKTNAGVGRQTARTAIQRLVSSGKLSSKNGAGNAIVYRLTT